MTLIGIIQILLFFLVLTLLVKPLGSYMARVYQGDRTFLTPIIGRFEQWLYKTAGIRDSDEMDWKSYGISILLFSGVGIVFLFLLLRFQNILPLNPQGFSAVAPDLALNTAVSFVTNTNWQNYGGETTLSLLSQMVGLTVQNFLSAATGMAVAIAFIRGLARRQSQFLGNFWVDLTRSVLYILLPLSLILALFLVASGSVQTLSSSVTVTTLDAHQSQEIALGPVASQVAIKHLGTNGGGFFQC